MSRCRLASVMSVGLALAGALAGGAAAQPSAAHRFRLTYRDFGEVASTGRFQDAGPVRIRFEGCYAKAGPEAICGFTLRALTPVAVTNVANLSHGTRADGAPMRTCCVFEQGRPEGFPITPAAQAPAGVATLRSTLATGQERGFLLRLPQYREGSPLTAITFSRGGGDPGVSFPAQVRPLP